MGEIEWRRGRFDEAIMHLERTTASYRRTGSTSAVAESELTLARMLWSRGDLAEARKRLEGTRAWLGELESDELLGARIDIELAGLMSETDSAPEALPIARAAMAAFEDRLSADSPQLARPLTMLAHVELANDHPARARAHAERSISLAEATGTQQIFEAAWSRFVLAQTLISERHHRTHALDLARAARAQLAAEGPPFQRDIEGIDAWLEAQGQPPSP